MATAVVFGAAGQIGRYLVPRLLDRGDRVIGISRQVRRSTADGFEWLRGDLNGAMPDLPRHDVIFSLGPLDAFGAWLGSTQTAGRTASSRSVDERAQQVRLARPAERALAEHLRRGEQRVIRAAESANLRWTLLRPTLIYGAGLDRSLSALARFGMRWRFVPQMRAATGLRQPVHADDLASACLAASTTTAATGRIFDLGGGERIPFAAMLQRLRASLPVRCAGLPLPFGLVRLALACAERLPQWNAIPSGALSRLQVDLVADHQAAQAVLGWSPRPFRPEPSTWQVRASV